MKKETEFWNHIEALDMTQAQLSRALGITESSVSEWKSGRSAPSAETYIELGKLARKAKKPKDALWFWEQAGLRREEILGISAQVIEELTTLPGDTQKIIVDEKAAGEVCLPGDVVVIEPLHSELKSLESFKDQFVLMKFEADAETYRHGPDFSWRHWPPGGGFFMGRLRFRKLDPRSFGMSAFLEGISKEQTLRPVWIGYWDHPGLPREAIPGSPRAKAAEEVARARAHERKLYKGLARGASTIHLTPEYEEAKRKLMIAENLLSNIEGAEARELQKLIESEAPRHVKLVHGCTIVGRIVAWFPAPGGNLPKESR